MLEWIKKYQDEIILGGFLMFVAALLLIYAGSQSSFCDDDFDFLLWTTIILN